MIPSNDDIAWSFAVLDKLPVPDGAKGEQSRAAYATLKRVVRDLQKKGKCERPGFRENYAAEIRDMVLAMPTLPVTRDNLNFERAAAVNSILQRVAQLHAQLYGDAKAGTHGSNAAAG